MKSSNIRRWMALAWLTALPGITHAVEPAATPAAPARVDRETWQHLVALLQDMEMDYPEAAEEHDEDELRQQRALAQEARELAQGLGPEHAARIAALRKIAARIDQGVDAKGVKADCAALIEDLETAGQLDRAPRHAPDLKRGAALFASSCAACHGKDGRARVPIAQRMDPKPTDLRDDEMAGVSPYRLYNILSFGISNTAMPSFSALSEEDRWALSFYVLTLRQPRCDRPAKAASLEVLAGSNDEALAALFGRREVACLRRRVSVPPQLFQARSRLATPDAHGPALAREQGRRAPSR